MTVVAKGHSYLNRESGREYLVVDVPYKRNMVNRLFRRNFTQVKVIRYPLRDSNHEVLTYPLQVMQRWALLDIPASKQEQHRRRGIMSFARDNTELNKKLTKNGQNYYLK